MTTHKLNRIADAVKRAFQSLSVDSKSGFGKNEAGFVIEKIRCRAKEQGVSVTVAAVNMNGKLICAGIGAGHSDAEMRDATDKAYTAALLKMPTNRIGDLCAEGQSLYGIQKTNNGRIAMVGGGEPVYIGGELLGGIGVCGAGAEIDMELSVYGARIADEIGG